MATWQLQDAKARFSEIVKLAANEPQEVTVHGESRVVVIATSEYKKLKKIGKQLPLGDFLMNSPVTGLDLDFSRDKSLPRDISFE
jgi:antitoxin Phd